MPLSDAKIRNLKPKSKPYKVSGFGGLFVLVKVSGSKSWRFKYRIDGKEKLIVFGGCRNREESAYDAEDDSQKLDIKAGRR